MTGPALAQVPGAVEPPAGAPVIVDLFCGEGGASSGYAAAGLRPVGVDLNDDHRDRKTRPRPKPLRRYPYGCVEMDALQALEELLGGGRVAGVRLGEVAAFHASPPCQLFSSISRINVRHPMGHHVDLIGPTRELLERTGLPYVIENVDRAAPMMRDPVMLCGSMFDPPMDVQRHRLFEASWPLEPPPWPCRHKLWAARYVSADYRGRASGRLMKVVPVYGGTRFAGDHALRRKAMEIDWMTSHGLKESIPPRYTAYVGARLLEHLAAVAA